MRKVFLQFSAGQEGAVGGDNSEALQSGNAEETGANQKAASSEQYDILSSVSQGHPQHKWADETAGPSSTSEKGEAEDQNADGVKEGGSKNSATEGDAGAENVGSQTNPTGPAAQTKTTNEPVAETETAIEEGKADVTMVGQAAENAVSLDQTQLHHTLKSFANTLLSFIANSDFPHGKELENAHAALEEGAAWVAGKIETAGVGNPAGKNIVRFDASLTPARRIQTLQSMLLSTAENSPEGQGKAALQKAHEHLVKFVESLA